MTRLLPTPDATHGRKSTRTGPLLPGAVDQLLPTPSATNSHGNDQRSDGRPLLPGVVRQLLPTPASFSQNGGDPHLTPGLAEHWQRKRGNLTEAMSDLLLPTPWASEGEKGGPNQHGSSGDLMLTSAVHHLLRTPTAQLAVNGGSQHPDKRRAGGHQPTLADEVEHLLPTPGATEGGGAREVPGKRTHDGPDHGPRLRDVVPLLPTPQVADVTGGHKSRSGDRGDEPLLPKVAQQLEHDGDIDWGSYAPAIYRWAEVTGREPPSPVEPGRNGKPRLSPSFVEFMMGLPDGWVTQVPGISRNAQLKALGNGVCPQQALLALRILARRVSPAWKR